MTTRFVLFVLALTVGVSTALGLLWLRDESLEAIEPAQPAVWAPATEPDAVEQRITFTLTRSGELSIPRGTRSGTVTGLGLAVGDRLTAESLSPGAPAPISIDGIDIPWLMATQPLYRSVGADAVGPDVDIVAGFLEESGYDTAHEAGAPVTRQMVAAIRLWALDHGFGKGQSAFDPSWVTWVSPEMVGQRVATLHARVGTSAADVGTDLARMAAPIASLTPSTDGSSSTLDPLGAGVREELVIDDVGYEWTDRSLSPAALSALDELVAPGATETSLPVRRSYPPNAVAVPIGSLVQQADGRYCLVTSADPRGRGVSEETVTVLGSSIGVAIVEGPLPFVLVNPAAAGLPLCQDAVDANR